MKTKKKEEKCEQDILREMEEWQLNRTRREFTYWWSAVMGNVYGGSLQRASGKK